MKSTIPQVLLFSYYLVGPLLTLLAFLSYFLFAPNQIAASIVWATACGLFFYVQCFLAAKLENKIQKSFKNFFFCLIVLFIFVFMITLIFNWHARFIDLLKSAIFYSFYSSSSLFT